MIFFFQAEDGIRDRDVTGVHVCSSDLSVDDILCSLIFFKFKGLVSFSKG